MEKWDEEVKELNEIFNLLKTEKEILAKALMEEMIYGQSGIECQNGRITRLLTQEEVWNIKKKNNKL